MIELSGIFAIEKNCWPQLLLALMQEFHFLLLIFQVAQLRDAIKEKQVMIDDLDDSQKVLILTHELLIRDFDKLKLDEVEKSRKLDELLVANQRRVQSRQDLKVCAHYVPSHASWRPL